MTWGPDPVRNIPNGEKLKRKSSTTCDHTARLSRNVAGEYNFSYEMS